MSHLLVGFAQSDWPRARSSGKISSGRLMNAAEASAWVPQTECSEVKHSEASIMKAENISTSHLEFLKENNDLTTTAFHPFCSALPPDQ